MSEKRFGSQTQIIPDATVEKGGGREHVKAGGVVNPQVGSPKGAVKMPSQSLDTGSGDEPHDGRAHAGFSGDDGKFQSTDSTGSPATLQPGRVAGLGAEGDGRNHGMPTDRTEWVTGSDTPNEGGIEGSPGHPSDGPERIPGDLDDEDRLNDTPDQNNDQRKSQI